MRITPFAGALVLTAAAAAQTPELHLPPPTSMYAKTAVRQALDGGDVLVYGTRMHEPNPGTAATIADSRTVGVVEFPTAGIDPADVVNLSNALRGTSTLPVGTFTSAGDPYLKPKLDAGLGGAVLERAEDAQEVRRFVDRLFFSPLGNRPGGPANASGYLNRFGEMIQGANQMMLAGARISTAKGVEQAEAIAKDHAAGLNLILVDRSGIAQSLGVPEGSAAHQAALARVEQAARAEHLALGTSAHSRAEAQALYARGYRYVAVGDDTEAVEKAFQRWGDVPADPAQEPPTLGEALSLGPNPVNAWLKEGKVVHLGFLMTPDLDMARVLARHTNALWIDAEHGPFSVESVRALISGLPKGTNVIVRVGNSQHPDIDRYLELGARGIVAPNVSSAAEAERFVHAVKDSHPEATAVVMVETASGVENAEAIARVKGVDAVHLGPYDLSLSIRHPIGSPEHQAAIARVEQACRAAQVPLGGVAPTRSQSYALHARGYQFLTTVSDQEAVAGFFKGL